MTIHFLRPAIEGNESASVRFTETYRTPPDDLWAALTDPERVARWFAPITGDLRPGGHVAVHFADEPATLRVLSCDAPHRVSLEWPQTWGATQVTAEVTPHEDGSTLTLTHRALTRHGAVDYGAGWDAHLQHLAAVLEDEDPTDWWTLFRIARPVYERRVSLDRPGLLAARHVPAEPARVYAMWTDAAQLRRWYAPVGGWIVSHAEVEARVGGSYEVAFGPADDPARYTERGTYTEVAPAARLAWDGVLSTSAGEENLHVEVEFLAAEGGTTVIVRETGMTDPETIQEHELGWATALDGLADSLGG